MLSGGQAEMLANFAKGQNRGNAVTIQVSILSSLFTMQVVATCLRRREATTNRM